MEEGNKVNHHLFVKENRKVSISEGTLQKVHALIGRYPDGKQK